MRRVSALARAQARHRRADVAPDQPSAYIDNVRAARHSWALRRTPDPVAQNAFQLLVANGHREIPLAAARIDALCLQNGLAPEIAFDINLAVDELVTNTIGYAYEDGGERRTGRAPALRDCERCRLQAPASESAFRGPKGFGSAIAPQSRPGSRTIGAMQAEDMSDTVSDRGPYSTIPPASALIAFECAARHGSFSQAAIELATSQSAISRHMALLEKDRSRPRPCGDRVAPRECT